MLRFIDLIKYSIGKYIAANRFVLMAFHTWEPDMGCSYNCRLDSFAEISI